MKKICLLLIAIGFLSCDDGNIDTPEFNFVNSDIDICGNTVMSKINGTEVLVIELNRDNTDNDFFTQVRENGEAFSLTEGGGNTITYRTFDNEPSSGYFCQNIPPTSPNVTNEWTGSGNLIVITELSIDDNDDVLAEDEDRNNDGDLTNDDTDGDLIADYIDFDDDGDGIKTTDEDVDGDGDPTNDDTDNDGIANYLDNDDDQDGVLTAFESTGDTDLDGIVDYLDADTILVGDERILANVYIETYTSSFEVSLLQLTNANGQDINFDTYNFGVESVPKSVTSSGTGTR